MPGTLTTAYKVNNKPIFNEPKWKSRTFQYTLVTTHPRWGTIYYYKKRPIKVELKDYALKFQSSTTPPETFNLGVKRNNVWLLQQASALPLTPRHSAAGLHLTQTNKTALTEGVEWLRDDQWLWIRPYGTSLKHIAASIVFLTYMINVQQLVFHHDHQLCRLVANMLHHRVDLVYVGQQPLDSNLIPQLQLDMNRMIHNWSPHSLEPFQKSYHGSQLGGFRRPSYSTRYINSLDKDVLYLVKKGCSFRILETHTCFPLPVNPMSLTPPITTNTNTTTTTLCYSNDPAQPLMTSDDGIRVFEVHHSANNRLCHIISFKKGYLYAEIGREKTIISQRQVTKAALHFYASIVETIGLEKPVYIDLTTLTDKKKTWPIIYFLAAYAHVRQWNFTVHIGIHGKTRPSLSQLVYTIPKRIKCDKNWAAFKYTGTDDRWLEPINIFIHSNLEWTTCVLKSINSSTLIKPLTIYAGNPCKASHGLIQRQQDLNLYLQGRDKNVINRYRLLAHTALSRATQKKFKWSFIDHDVRDFVGRFRKNSTLFLRQITGLPPLFSIVFQTWEDGTITLLDGQPYRVGTQPRQSAVRATPRQLFNILGWYEGFDKQFPWIANNAWTGLIGAVEWTPTIDDNLLQFFETERSSSTHKLTAEKHLNTYQMGLLLHNQPCTMYSADWIALILSMLTFDRHRMILWCRAQCLKFTQFSQQRKKSDFITNVASYNKRVEVGVLKPFKHEKDVREALRDVLDNNEIVWTVPTLVCRTKTMIKKGGFHQKQFAHIINTLVNYHGYSAHADVYVYKTMAAYEFLMVGAFVLCEFKKAPLEIILLDLTRLADAADKLFNPRWYTEPSPSPFIFSQDDVVEYEDSLQTLFSLMRVRCAWIYSNEQRGSALVHTCDTIFTAPPSGPYQTHAAAERACLYILLTLFEFTKTNMEHWDALVQNMPSTLQSIVNELAASLTITTKGITISDVDPMIVELFWRLFIMYIGSINDYDIVTDKKIILDSKIMLFAQFNNHHNVINLPRVDVYGIVFQIHVGFADILQEFVIVTDQSKGADGIVHPHILLQNRTQIYTPNNIVSEPTIVPTVEEKLEIQWKENYRECRVQFHDLSKGDVLVDTYLPDCMSEMLHAVVIENQTCQFQWIVQDRQPDVQTDQTLLQPFRYQNVCLPRHPLTNPLVSLREEDVLTRSLKPSRAKQVYKVDYNAVDKIISLRGKTLSKETQSTHLLPITDNITVLPDVLELNVNVVPTKNIQVDNYLSMFLQKIVYSGDAFRHLFTTIFCRPLEMFEQTLDHVRHAVPTRPRWAIIEFTEVTSTKLDQDIVWSTYSKSTVVKTHIKCACENLYWKPMLVHFLHSCFKTPLNVNACLIRVNTSAVIQETIEAILVANLGTLPTWRCVIIQHPAEFKVNRDTFDHLPFIVDVRVLDGAVEENVHAQKRIIYVALDSPNKKKDIVLGIKANLLDERIQVRWVNYDNTYTPTPQKRNFVVIYKTTDKWSLKYIRNIIGKHDDPTVKLTICFKSKSKTLPDPSEEFNGRLQIFYFHDTPAICFSQWMRSDTTMSAVTRLGPTTLDFTEKPDYGLFFEEAPFNPKKQLAILTVPAISGLNYFFYITAQTPCSNVFEHGLIHQYLFDGLLLDSVRKHHVDELRAQLLFKKQGKKWNWISHQDLSKRQLTEGTPLHRPIWYGCCYDNLQRPILLDGMSRSRLILKIMDMLDDAIQCKGNHTLFTSTYNELQTTLVFSHCHHQDKPQTEIVFNLVGRPECIVHLLAEDDRKVVTVLSSGKPGPVFIQASPSTLLIAFARAYAIGCVTFVIDTEDVQLVAFHLKQFEYIFNCALGCVALVNYLDSDPDMNLHMNGALVEAFEDKDFYFCATHWNKTHIVDPQTIYAHRELKRRLLALCPSWC